MCIRDRDGKFRNIINDIKEKQEIGQPVLLGTASIENSEYISKLLQKEKIKHEVLNAKQHKKESMIIAQAGRPGAVTIATNMAGRGTDIVLGGNLDSEIKSLGEGISQDQIDKTKKEWSQRHQEVIDAGGLHILVQNGMSLGELIIN